MRAVQFCVPFSQLSMCVATNPALRRPERVAVSAASLAIIPAKFASTPSRLSLSHSNPRPLLGAGGNVNIATADGQLVVMLVVEGPETWDAWLTDGYIGEVPEVQRPRMTDYGVPADPAGALPFEWARERLAANRNYWLVTVDPAGRPHSTPVWGVWLDNALYFGTDPQSFKYKNLAANPAVAVHLESGDEVVQR